MAKLHQELQTVVRVFNFELKQLSEFSCNLHILLSGQFSTNRFLSPKTRKSQQRIKPKTTIY